MSLWLAGVISIWYHDACYKEANRSICLSLRRLGNELHDRSCTHARSKHANIRAVQLAQFAQHAVLYHFSVNLNFCKIKFVYENGTYELNKQEGLEIRFGFDCIETVMSREGYCFGDLFLMFRSGYTTRRNTSFIWMRVILIADRFPLTETCFVFISLV